MIGTEETETANATGMETGTGDMAVIVGDTTEVDTQTVRLWLPLQHAL